MNVAHPDGFRFADLCAGEDCIMVRHHHAPTKFDSFVDVVPEHEWETIPAILDLNCEGQLGALRSVVRALDDYMTKAARTPHLITPNARQNFIDDVAIWWLYEFFAGRGLQYVILDVAERERIRGYASVPGGQIPRSRSARALARTPRR